MIFRSGKRFGTLLGEQFNGRHLVGLYADVALGHLGTLHQQFQTNQYLVGMLHHQTIVGGDIRFALYSIDNHALSLSRWWRTEFDKRGETSTTHSNNTSGLDALNDFLRCQFGMVLHQFQLVRAVNGLFPLITLYINDNHGLAIASGVDGGINLEHCTANR